MSYPIEISDRSWRGCGLSLAATHEERRRSTLQNGMSAPFAGLPGLRVGVAEPTRRGVEERDMRAITRGLADVLFDRLAHQFRKFCFDQDGKPHPL
jgi:glycine/serine hydroxymethyltransferase